jgi:DNA-binding NarL/FixJ family response regulator
MAMPPTGSIRRRSSSSVEVASGSTLVERISFMASGCAGSVAALRLATSCAPRSSCSPAWAGTEAFAERAERELLATGERVRKRSVERRDELTAQETQVARLARDGLSNADIGQRLFISQHTVAYHLRKVFTKLGITSRNQLARALPDSATANVEQTA